MILKTKKLVKLYHQGETEIKALDNVEIEVQQGQTLSIIGPSGSGKSTLLSLLAGLDQASSGQVEILGQDLGKLSEDELSAFRGKHIGIVFQQFHLLPHLSALENVSLALELTGQNDIEARAMDALDQVGLKDRYHHRPQQLSGGECQRVAVARAMVVRPALLLADEPSGNLDTKTGDQIMNLLFQLVKENNMTMVLVTHNNELAEKCQRQVRLSGGQLQ